MIHSTNHWSHDITNSLCQDTVTHFSPRDNKTSDDICREKSKVRGNHTQCPFSAKVDSVECFTEKNTGNESLEKETSVNTKAGPWQENGDHSGSILNREGRPEKVLDLNGES